VSTSLSTRREGRKSSRTDEDVRRAEPPSPAPARLERSSSGIVSPGGAATTGWPVQASVCPLALFDRHAHPHRGPRYAPRRLKLPCWTRDHRSLTSEGGLDALAAHSSWTSVKIGGFTGKLVRLTGWLMFDSAHAHHSHKANNDDRDHAGHPLNRATNWEVHPVTKFESCNSTIAKCKAGTVWKDVP